MEICCWIARGDAEILHEIARAGYKEKIWDCHAAVGVIIQEAGGMAQMLEAASWTSQGAFTLEKVAARNRSSIHLRVVMTMRLLHAGTNPGAALVSKLCTSETVLKAVIARRHLVPGEEEELRADGGHGEVEPLSRGGEVGQQRQVRHGGVIPDAPDVELAVVDLDMAFQQLRQSPELNSRFATATIWFGGTSSCHIPGRISHMPLEQWNTSAELRSSADDCSMVMDMVVVPPGVRRGSPLEAANVLSANPPTTWKLPCHVTPTHL
ncbi:hypothetical protein HU200_002610 [Digitaria exilis]|uniref:Uncharacterized protein n=1 Tax=Digitaria exilis TaxID=1010633 RepID=A0A835FWK2_9POAL|nr:hypothetical protein HU200_002610 [Digitaria exilis]